MLALAVTITPSLLSRSPRLTLARQELRGFLYLVGALHADATACGSACPDPQLRRCLGWGLPRLAELSRVYIPGSFFRFVPRSYDFLLLLMLRRASRRGANAASPRLRRAAVAPADSARNKSRTWACPRSREAPETARSTEGKTTSAPPAQRAGEHDYARRTARSRRRKKIMSLLSTSLATYLAT